jgi:DNA polymerase III alpha subunit (gram-positive type)
VLKVNYAFIDVEATGLDKGADDVIQFAAIMADENLVPKSFINVYFDTDRAISKEAQDVTGLDKEKLKVLSRGARLNSYCQKIASILGNSVVVGHNVDFDIKILQSNLRRHCNIDVVVEERNVICTMHRYRGLTRLNSFSTEGYKFPSLDDLSSFVCKELKRSKSDIGAKFASIFKTTGTVHDALYDAFSCLYCLKYLK